MSRKSDIVRLYRILELIEDAAEIATRHGGIEAALLDKEGEYALTMILTQIGERLGKLESEDFILALPVRDAAGLRNVIVHDYEGLSRGRVKLALEHSLPALKEVIQGLVPPL